jgi:hypothetical protein
MPFHPGYRFVRLVQLVPRRGVRYLLVFQFLPGLRQFAAQIRPHNLDFMPVMIRQPFRCGRRRPGCLLVSGHPGFLGFAGIKPCFAAAPSSYQRHYQ